MGHPTSATPGKQRPAASPSERCAWPDSAGATPVFGALASPPLPPPTWNDAAPLVARAAWVRTAVSRGCASAAGRRPALPAFAVSRAAACATPNRARVAAPTRAACHSHFPRVVYAAMRALGAMKCLPIAARPSADVSAAWVRSAPRDSGVARASVFATESRAGRAVATIPALVASGR